MTASALVAVACMPQVSRELEKECVVSNGAKSWLVGGRVMRGGKDAKQWGGRWGQGGLVGAGEGVCGEQGNCLGREDVTLGGNCG